MLSHSVRAGDVRVVVIDGRAAGAEHLDQDDGRRFANVIDVLLVRQAEDEDLGVAQRLAAIDPSNTTYYEARLRDFDARWQKALAEWDRRAAPLKGIRVVPYHKNLTYLIRWLGLVEAATIESKPGVPPSAGALSDLLARLKASPADAIARAAYDEAKAPEWLAQRTGMPIVVVPYTVGGTPEAKDLFSLFDVTLDRLLAAKN